MPHEVVWREPLRMSERTRARLDSSVFDLPVQELRRGYRSDVYFWRSKVVLERQEMHPEVTMQVFQKQRAVLCGVDEALAILELASGRYRDERAAYAVFDELIELKRRARRVYRADRATYLSLMSEKVALAERLDALWEPGFDALEISALRDGDEIAPWEPVMHIRGDYSLFAHLETIYLGVLARRTRVATNVRRVVDASGGKPVLYFPARFDHWAVQGGDGYAAHVGGAQGVSTDAQGEWWGADAAGTVPHALIAALGGDTVAAVRAFGAEYPEVKLVALVDFDNDVVETSLRCCRALGERLWGVRVDTSENLVDRSLLPEMGRFRPNGVCPELVCLLRRELDRAGFSRVRIIASGGFDAERILEFEERRVPVDAYGVGSALLGGRTDFTADVVEVDGAPLAKVGRSLEKSARLELVNEERSDSGSRT